MPVVNRIAWRRRLGEGLATKAIPLAGVVLQQAVHSAFAQRTAQRTDGSLQRIFCDGDLRPERIEQLVFRHNAFAMADQVGEQIENARLQGNFAIRQGQHTSRLVQPKRPKRECLRGASFDLPLHAPKIQHLGRCRGHRRSGACGQTGSARASNRRLNQPKKWGRAHSASPLRAGQ